MQKIRLSMWFSTFDTKIPIFAPIFVFSQFFVYLNAMIDQTAYLLIAKLPTGQKWRQFGKIQS